MKLFKLTTAGNFEHIPSIWVIASDPTEAETIVGKVLDASDYGFRGERKIVKIELIAEDNLYADKCGVLFLKDAAVRGLEPRKNLNTTGTISVPNDERSVATMSNS